MRLGLIGSMSIDEAVVTDISDNEMTVVANPECESPATCSACAGRTRCMQSKRAQRVTLNGTATRLFEIGQRVYVEHFVVNEACAAIALFVFPLLGAAAGYWVWSTVSGSSTESGGSVAAAIVGFIAGFVPGALFERVLTRAVAPATIIGPVWHFDAEANAFYNANRRPQ